MKTKLIVALLVVLFVTNCFAEVQFNQFKDDFDDSITNCLSMSSTDGQRTLVITYTPTTDELFVIVLMDKFIGMPLQLINVRHRFDKKEPYNENWLISQTKENMQLGGKQKGEFRSQAEKFVAGCLRYNQVVMSVDSGLLGTTNCKFNLAGFSKQYAKLGCK